MPKTNPKSTGSKPTLTEMRRNLAERIAVYTPSCGENTTAVQGLSLFRQTACTPCYMASVEPSVSVFVQGRKRINIGGVEYLCDESSFLVASIDVPVQSQIIEASEAVPQLAMRLKLDMQMVREVVSRG